MSSARERPWTPAPWTFTEDEFSHRVTVVMDDRYSIDALARGAEDLAVWRPNFRLIALAPRMAETLGVFEDYTPTIMRAFGRHFPSLQRPLDDAHRLLEIARGT